jgi:putative endonuclease
MKGMDKKLKGKIGEKYAEKFLISRGYQIIEKNYYSRFGEIDIIAKKEDEIVFFEVKARTSEKYGTGEEAVNANKIKKILKSAYHFLQTTEEKQIHDLRIDIIAIKLNRYLKPIKLRHIKNITDG